MKSNIKSSELKGQSKSSADGLKSEKQSNGISCPATNEAIEPSKSQDLHSEKAGSENSELDQNKNKEIKDKNSHSVLSPKDKKSESPAIVKKKSIGDDSDVDIYDGMDSDILDHVSNSEGDMNWAFGDLSQEDQILEDDCDTGFSLAMSPSPISVKSSNTDYNDESLCYDDSKSKLSSDEKNDLTNISSVPESTDVQEDSEKSSEQLADKDNAVDCDKVSEYDSSKETGSKCCDVLTNAKNSLERGEYVKVLASKTPTVNSPNNAKSEEDAKKEACGRFF